MTAPELKPCPFCGEKAVTEILIVEGVVFCSGCRATIIRKHEVKEDTGQDNAIAAWNRRADLAAVQPAQVQPDQTVEIDLRAAMMVELEKAASESPWVPEEYYMNEVISDCCAFLREDRTPQPAQGDYFEGLEEGIKIGRGEPQPEYEQCWHCAGSGMVIGDGGDPSLCHYCHGDTVLQIQDPRDEVIKGLVDALGLVCASYLLPPKFQVPIAAALAAAKAVQHD